MGPRWPYWQLFEILQLHLLRRHAEALKEVQLFIARADLDPSHNANDLYFQTYAKWLGATAFSALFPGMDRPSSLTFDPSAVPLDRVSSRWRRTFLMTVHPDSPDNPFNRSN